MTKTLHSQWREPEFIPWSENWVPHAPTKTWGIQINKNKCFFKRKKIRTFVWPINLWLWFQPRLLAQRYTCATVGASTTLGPTFLKRRNETLCKTAFKLHKWFWATELHVAISYDKVIGISRNQTNIVPWLMSFSDIFIFKMLNF